MGTGLGGQIALEEQILTLEIRRGMVMHLWTVKRSSLEREETTD